MKEAQVLHLLQLQSIELLHVGNKQTQLRDNGEFVTIHPDFQIQTRAGIVI